MLNNNIYNCQKVISAKVDFCDSKNNITLLIDAGCESCTSSCIMSAASKKITLHADKKYNKGDTVSLIIDEKYMLKLSILLYGLPLVIMFAVSLIIDTIFHKDTLTAISAALSLIISWLVLKYISKSINKSPVKILE